MLNSDDPVDLWCLHFIYIKLINSALATFVNGWCHHPMSSANGLSPLQLWMQGMLTKYHSGLRITEEMFHNEVTDYVSFMMILSRPLHIIQTRIPDY